MERSRESEYCAVCIPPALPPLLHLPAAFWSSHNLRGLWESPFPSPAQKWPPIIPWRRRRRVDNTPGLGHTRGRTALQTEFCSEVPTQHHVWPHLLSMVAAMSLSPLVLPLYAKKQWEGQKQPVHGDEDRFPSAGQSWGTVGGGSYT